MRNLEQQLTSRGITGKNLLSAFAEVPREKFVAPALEQLAYADRPLSIGFGQTISQPYIVALTIDKMELQPGDEVLEIGTGSGYSAAVLSRVCAWVVSVERLPELAHTATERLARLGYSNVTVICGDGTQGCPNHAPYDAIAVAAGGPQVPRALREQLKVGGRLVIPVGGAEEQSLVRVRRLSPTEFRQEQICKVRFVPLIGQQGWPEESDRSAP